MTYARAAVTVALLLSPVCGCGGTVTTDMPSGSALRVGVAAVRLTPCGQNPDWDGPITPSGVWGESVTDKNGNGRWDPGEVFIDDPLSSQLDAGSPHKYDGIFLAGFGNNRIASGCHDDLWARVIVLQSATRKVALVSVDFVGQLLHGSYYGFAHARDMVDPQLGLDAILFSGTHDHEAPDTLGLWGVTEFSDGKFPRYLQFVDRQVARAINVAAAPATLQPARVVAARTTAALTAELRGLQVRTRCRPPFFFDDELRALQFVGADDKTIATLIPAPSVVEEAADVCLGQHFEPNFARRTVPTHYHESLSVGVNIAATTTCYALQLLGRDADAAANGACKRALDLP